MEFAMKKEEDTNFLSISFRVNKEPYKTHEFINAPDDLDTFTKDELQEMFPNVTTMKQIQFIKRKYKENIERFQRNRTKKQRFYTLVQVDNDIFPIVVDAKHERDAKKQLRNLGTVKKVLKVSKEKIDVNEFRKWTAGIVEMSA